MEARERNEMDRSVIRVEDFQAIFVNPERSFTLRADFKVSPGERVAILGPSGCGKTTLLRWMAGLLQSERTGDVRGRFWFGESERTHFPPEKRRVGFVFQDYALFSDQTVLQNVTFGLEMRGASRTEAVSVADRWIERLGLTDRRNFRAGVLSGGEKQRVALARALAWNPDYLLLDEPFSALDPENRKMARERVLETLKVASIPTLLVTHDSEDVGVLATRQLNYEFNQDSATHHFR